MTIVVLNSIQKIESPPRQLREWGDRLIASYRLSVEFENVFYEFIWVMAGSENESPCTEYDDDFDDFLVAICKGKRFKRCKNFVNEVQEKFSLAVHYFHSRDMAIETDLPITVYQKSI
ncbi:hypothetical protein A3759_17055 [Thalassolituus sp. HI0120]|nr:hypothetical protein A3759_17055 [Thalassolituus sp. HI0120]